MAEHQTGRLTTHVLDTSLGRPAAGIGVSLFRLDGETRQSILDALTNADGRCDQPLLSGDDFRPGRYELVFAAGDYLRRTQGRLAEPLFLDDVVIRFGMAEAAHYHVPLLLSPFGYSTYRGS
ncbi:hydroxyisourate hydrolase [Mangrovicella endophytica]|uniref:hydroxyisourate hydrolase n=1 Tax=Mangrovicella endophytica TaxID=2066697 RepID=UPI000C9E1553|nr:hydroxyisourate hydrolase [Mangrovicella endophytica]